MWGHVQGVSQNCLHLVFCHFVSQNSSKMQKLGVFWKIQDICYTMDTEIFKIEEETTEKIKPPVANPLQKWAEYLLSIYID